MDINSRKQIFLTVITTIIICSIFFTVNLVITCNTRPNMSQMQSVNINQLQEEEKISINQATKEELMSLPGIGEKLSTTIIENRPYSSIHDLKKIKGLGEGIFKSIEKKVTI